MTGKEFREKWPRLHECICDLHEDSSWDDIEMAINSDLEKQCAPVSSCMGQSLHDNLIGMGIKKEKGGK